MALREYLEQHEINALLEHAEHEEARLLMLTQWRAGLRVSEVLALEVRDIQMKQARPQVAIRQGKGKKSRYVPMHPELTAAYMVALNYRRVARTGRIFGVGRMTVHRWIKRAYESAVESRKLPPGRNISSHTLRHSFARHVLMEGVPINRLQVWLGHAQLQTTLDYLQILPDPEGIMEGIS